jgi:hypothetical protein
MKDVQWHLRVLTCIYAVLAFWAIGLAIATGLSPWIITTLMPGSPQLPRTLQIFLLFGAVGMFGIGLAIALAAKFMRRRTNYLFCVIIAGVMFLVAPIIGIWALVVLTRREVIKEFEVA